MQWRTTVMLSSRHNHFVAPRRAVWIGCKNKQLQHLTRASAHSGKRGQLTPWKNWWKLKKREHAKKNSFLCLCCILRAVISGRCKERRYADHIFIQIYFRMHHFVVKFSKFSSLQAAREHWPPNQNPADVPEHWRIQTVPLSSGKPPHYRFAFAIKPAVISTHELERQGWV